jgi:hypothetical protein
MKKKIIMGVELRSIDIDFGLEHEKFSADIYINNVKAGEVLNDGWCEELYFEFIDDEMIVKFNSILKKYCRQIHAQISPDKLIYDILHLNRHYKCIKDETLKDTYLLTLL